MRQIKDEQAMIIRLPALDPNTTPPRPSRNITTINADMDLPASDADQPRILRRSLVHIAHVAMRRIGSLRYRKGDQR